ncbi:hypothetical protein GCM10011575_12500 [Microlunatus endophyticus]|uniref:Uncharacterized protein n=1 Tax=Microlunatus endophyticus TaxID=1716077 RepID=A0A917W2W2_9ACTN|nr:hypothetical protein GCM10011575_12500 [Microlunatus endophyticus]
MTPESQDIFLTGSFRVDARVPSVSARVRRIRYEFWFVARGLPTQTVPPNSGERVPDPNTKIVA